LQAATDMAESVAERISGQVAQVTDEVTQLTGQVADKVKERREQVTDQLTQVASRGMEAAGDMAEQVRRTRQDVTNAIAHAIDEAPTLVPDAPRAQDTILLGIAGVAVAAALGLALQRASNET
jgi:ElaB/YqjD/DUF883 family membrane-anchored ribosome-binding protein